MRRDRGGFGQDQAGRGALRVVFGHQGVGHAAAANGAARVSGAMTTRLGKFEVADADRIEKFAH